MHGGAMRHFWATLTMMPPNMGIIPSFEVGPFGLARLTSEKLEH